VDSARDKRFFLSPASGGRDHRGKYMHEDKGSRYKVPDTRKSSGGCVKVAFLITMVKRIYELVRDEVLWRRS
jgi:hypothetical protein